MTESAAVAAPPAAEPRPHAVTVWYALSAGVAWWALHLVGVASLTPLACEHPGVQWLMHGATIVCAVGALSAMLAAVAVRVQDAARAITTERNRFLGSIALLVNVAALALILLEDLPIWFVRPC